MAVPTMGTSGMTVTHVSCGFNSHRPPQSPERNLRHSFGALAHFRRAPALQAGGGRGRADTLHQNSPVAYARSIRSAENGESSVQLAGLAPIGEWCNALHPCLGSTWSEFNPQFPDQNFSVRARGDGWPSLRTKCTHVRILPGAPKSCYSRTRKGIGAVLRTFKRDTVRMTSKRVIWGVVS